MLGTPRRRLCAALVGATIAVGIAGCGGGSSSSSSTSSSASTAAASASTASTPAASTQMGFEGVPIEPGAILAPASSTQTDTVDGIQCGPTEQLVYHIHAHLMVYVGGSPRALPGGIGIPGSVVAPTSEGPVAEGGQCIYWLHTHAPDGIIHIESPTQTIYTLGEFFDEWHQPLSPTQVAGAHGKVTAIVNGSVWRDNPRAIRLEPHAVIQLDVGKPTPPFQGVNWANTQL